MKTSRIILLLLTLAAISFSCKKDAHVPPDLSFSSGGIYTSGDATVSTSTAVTFGFIATKTEDDLKSVNVSYTYDNGSSVSFNTYKTNASEREYFAKDVVITTRAIAGTEKWTFTVTDLDGNITSKSITLTVN